MRSFFDPSGKVILCACGNLIPEYHHECLECIMDRTIPINVDFVAWAISFICAIGIIILVPITYLFWQVVH